MNRADYVVIESWMISDLGLSGNYLLVYGLIYGFSRDGVSCFFGNYDYIKKHTGISSDKTVTNVLNYLVENGLLIKEERFTTTGKSNGYKAITEPKKCSVEEDVNKDEELSIAEEKSSKFEPLPSYDDILTDFGVKDKRERKAYFDFITHCRLNSRTVTNDKLERLIVRLDRLYRDDINSKINALHTAIDKGYFDIKD